MTWIDSALAFRLERLDVVSNLQCVRAIATLRPALGATVLECSGGSAAFAGVDSPLTRAVGLGIQGEVSDEAFDAVEAVAFDNGASSIVEVCPFADPSVLRHLGERWYRPLEMINVCFREIVGFEPAEPPAGMTVEPVDATNAEEWVAAISQGFLGGPDVPETFSDIARGFLLSSNGHAFLARVDGEPAGGGNLFMLDRLAGLSGSAVLPAFRNRGVHAALVQARLAEALKLGCDLVTMSATPGSGSHRNVERLGFRVAYTRVVYSSTGKDGKL